jgi:hypothetical protein
MNQAIDRQKLYYIGNLSIFMIGLGFAVRANIAPNLQAEIYEYIDAANAAAMVGEALGSTFIGFALTLLFGSALVDYVGMKKMMLLSAIGYILGSCGLLYAAANPTVAGVDNVVLTSLLLTGLGWGAVEASSNPMVASLYPEEKTKRLNILHAWWPAGIVVGGLLGVGVDSLGWAWEINMFILIVPAVILAIMVLGAAFPVTERVAEGVTYGEMMAELRKRPLFWVFWVSMFFTAAAELAPGTWVNISLSNIVGMQGILLLVYVSGLMFVMRHFAGQMVERFSSVGLMFISCTLAGIGLYLLSLADSPLLAFAAATIWGIGVCYLWPTLLGITSGRFPRGGALALGLMGFGGGLAIYYVLPEMGGIYDAAKAAALASGVSAEEAVNIASVQSFQSVAIVPLLMLPVYGAIWLYDRKNGGLNAETAAIVEENSL